MAEERSISIEVVYRGIFQKTLAQRICRSVVLAARRSGHTGTAFARYGDSPERNGVPAKQFAVVAADEIELEASMAKYEPSVVDVSIAVDDTLVKGVESWAWYGRQPIWKPVRANGWLLVTSEKTADAVLAQTDKAERHDRAADQAKARHLGDDQRKPNDQAEAEDEQRLFGVAHQVTLSLRRAQTKQSPSRCAPCGRLLRFARNDPRFWGLPVALDAAYLALPLCVFLAALHRT